jgi:hypothetical protein
MVLIPQSLLQHAPVGSAVLANTANSLATKKAEYCLSAIERAPHSHQRLNTFNFGTRATHGPTLT